MTSTNVPTNSVRYRFMTPPEKGMARLLDATQDKAFQIVRFRDADEHRMVTALHSLLDDRHVSMAVNRRLVHHRLEHCLADVVGTAALDDVAARLEQLNSPQVDFLVAGQRVRH